MCFCFVVVAAAVVVRSLAFLLALFLLLLLPLPPLQVQKSMSTEVLSLAAMGDNKLVRSPGVAGSPLTSANSHEKALQMASPSASASADPSALPSSSLGTSKLPFLSALAARNHQLHAHELFASSSPAGLGLLASVGQERRSPTTPTSMSTTPPPPSSSLNAAASASGIVSHLRAASGQRQDLESLAKAVAEAAASQSSLLALQQAYLAATAATVRDPAMLSPLAFRALRDLTSSGLSASSANSTFNPSLLPSSLARLIPSLVSLSAHQDALLGKPQPHNRADASILSSTLLKKATSLPKLPRNPITLFMDCDEDSLSEYQCLIRQQMELFEATAEEAASSVQGRNKQILPGQVGVRCRHCSNIAARRRSKGSMYFPTKLDRIYQAAQNLSAFHLCEHCPYVPAEVREKILILRERKSPAGGGKRYWAEGVRCLGVVEDPSTAGLRFKSV